MPLGPLGLLALLAAEPTPFIRAGIDTPKPIWGLRDGLRFALTTDVGGGDHAGGPRGLIRVGYPILAGGGVALVNFIAVEPIVVGQTQRAFSELEPSADGQPGKLLVVQSAPGDAWSPAQPGDLYPGLLETLAGGVRRLTVGVAVERFVTGAHVQLLLSVREDRPDELELRPFAEAGSAPLAACILTATMGNLERLRQLHLTDRVVDSRELYADWTGDEFAQHRHFDLADLPRAADGGIVVAATTDEADPAAVVPDPTRPWHWHYPGRKLTQYWRKPPGTWSDELRVTVNARRHYWMSRLAIPGGASFENFELNETHIDGRPVIFGLTPRAPQNN